MSDVEDAIRRRAYELWEHAGMPKGRSDEFWYAARLELGAKQTMEEKIDALGPPIVEPPILAAPMAPRSDGRESGSSNRGSSTTESRAS